ncbi:MAG: B12-binding domain-containing radical SAM protein [Chitinispirillia bacterium]|nr:B12-binding domain-containing radical SAM protein [Chitinispirillia bacterium]MCL2242617.1 B12-binding domain-containing radical SAM protein [Chitinispirillia bacterium]
MKICLIRPPVFCRSMAYPSGPRFGLPLSLLYLGASMEEAGYGVEVYDALLDFDGDVCDLRPGEDGVYHIGASYESIGRKVRELGPDVVGITNPFSDFFSCTVETAEAVKAALPDIPVIVGGPHATSDPASFLYEGSPVDYVMRAECELSVLELLKVIGDGAVTSSNPGLSSVPNIAYLRDGEITTTPPGSFIADLDSLPLPAYHLADVEKTFSLVKSGFPSRYSFEYPGSHREVSIITSRGCPYDCVFCGNHLHMGRKWRYHSVDYVIRHMELLVTKHNVRHFHIEDDNLGMDPARFEEFLDALIAKNWGVTWDTPNGIRADRMNASVISKAKKSGCTYLIFGVESGNQRVLDKVINKSLDLAAVTRTARDAYRCRLDVHAFYVVGFPGETRKEINDTFRYALKLLSRYDVIPHLCLARPLPGTRLYGICEENGYLTDPVLPQIGKGLRGEMFSRRMIKTDEFGPELLEELVKGFNRKMMMSTAMKSILFLLMHPLIAVKVIKKFSGMAGGLRLRLVRLFFGGLFFKFNYLTKR